LDNGLRPRSKRLYAALFLLLIGAFFRLWAFESAPPGMQHDEYFKANEAEALVHAGDFQVFYPTNQGHEGGYVWLAGLSNLLFGVNMVMVRMPAFWLGMLTLAWLYRFGREAFSFRVAFLACGLAAISFWPVFTNRVGLRANMLPLVTLMTLWGLWRICSSQRHQWGMAIFTGIMLGLAIYTYTAAFTLYLALGAFLLALAVERRILRRHWRELALAVLLGGLLTLPMVNVRLNDPQGQNRAGSISAPWAEFKEGKPERLLENVRLLAGMLIAEGDPEWRYNIAGRLLFLLPVGILIYLGLARLLWRHRPIEIMLVGLAIFGLIPSLLTTSAPSFLRSINTLPSLMLAFALGVDLLGRWSGRAVWGAGIAALMMTAFVDGRAYFDTWANEDEVFAIYRDDLEQLAAYLRDIEEPYALVSTSNPEFLDSGIYRFQNPPATDLMWFDGRVNTALSLEPRLMFVSPLAPISPAHDHWLASAEHLAPLLHQNGEVAFQVYRLNPDYLTGRLEEVSQWPIFLTPPPPFPSDQLVDWGIPYDYPVNFGNLVQLVGVEMPKTTIPYQDNGVDSGLPLQLYWEPLVVDYPEPLSFFVHLIAWDGSVHAGRDFLGTPAQTWIPGTVFVQDNYVGNYTLEPRPYFVAVGLYNTRTGQRYPIIEGQNDHDQVILGQLTIGPRED
jgi:4-amino-4-deoxy-L-arabinose transferase-like glycosyltransferase